MKTLVVLTSPFSSEVDFIASSLKAFLLNDTLKLSVFLYNQGITWLAEPLGCDTFQTLFKRYPKRFKLYVCETQINAQAFQNNLPEKLQIVSLGVLADLIAEHERLLTL